MENKDEMQKSHYDIDKFIEQLYECKLLNLMKLNLL